ncbi:DoxX family protein [Novosphingobium aquimarinum]|uniref:DoxX family protein n=1 Tax=Novosphingobium aquimarinum TaxID=2682494 RepID=UPI0012EB6D6B|nr:DoxX family protein [Novosphingobium aquimarinum]
MSAVTPRAVVRVVLGTAYAAAGVLHLASPGPFVSIVPEWVPAPATVVALTGVAELAGAVGLVQPFVPPLRRLAGWGLAAYALCVWPANVQHMLIDMAQPDHGLGLSYHIPRLAFQPVLIWVALWASSVIDWPFARKRR